MRRHGSGGRAGGRMEAARVDVFFTAAVRLDRPGGGCRKDDVAALTARTRSGSAGLASVNPGRHGGQQCAGAAPGGRGDAGVTRACGWCLALGGYAGRPALLPAYVACVESASRSAPRSGTTGPLSRRIRAADALHGRVALDFRKAVHRGGHIGHRGPTRCRRGLEADNVSGTSAYCPANTRRVSTS